MNKPYWFEGEKKALKPRERITPSEWAEKYRIVTKSSRPGPWRNSVTPYLKEIMDTWALPYVREVVVCAAPQTGKTETMFNCLAWQSDRGGGDALVVMPGEKTVKRMSQDRILPMFEASSQLADLKSDDPDDTSMGRISLRNGRVIYTAWASSPQLLASVPILDIYFDEVDKYPPFSGKEADPISLGAVRQRTYPQTSKMLKISTPTLEPGPIWQGMNTCAEIRDYHVPCPYCGAMQQMVFEQIKWPKDERSPKRIRQLDLARYECSECGAEWNNFDRDKAVASGEWVPRERIDRPRSVGFHIPSWYSTFVSLSEVAADFLKGQKDKAALMHWCNAHAAEPWIDDEVEPIDPLRLMARREVFTAALPESVGVITAAVDVQNDRLEMEVVAWADGEESWSLDYRKIYGDPTRKAVWKELAMLLEKQWEHPSGVKMGIKATCVDSGFRTKEVYEFCRARFHRGVYATKGQSTPGKALVGKPTKQKALRGKPVLVFPVGTDTAKDTLFGRLEISEPGPGFCHFPQDRDEEYFEQFATEKVKIYYRRGQPYRVWEKVSGSARNEAIDLRALNMVALAIINPQWGLIMAKLIEQSSPPKVDTPQASKRKLPMKKGFVNGWR